MRYHVLLACTLFAPTLLAPLACKPRKELDESALRAAGDGASPTYAGPAGGLDPTANAQLWKKYCTGGASVADPVNPNYADPDVKEAAKILSIVKPTSYKLYYDMLKMHKTPKPSNVAGLSDAAHEFLTYLCGEFRDRASMIKAKIAWIYNSDPALGPVGPHMHYLARSGGGKDKSCAKRNDPRLGDTPDASLPATEAFDRNKSPWAQMCIEDYRPYLSITNQVFQYRLQQLRQGGQGSLKTLDGDLAKGPLRIGARSDIDRTTPGFTICETKFVFANYVKKGRPYMAAGQGNEDQAYASYVSELAQFRQGCSEEDLNWYYDFRGDSNFKPNSPEGNAMIWMGKVAAAQCATRDKAKPGMSMTDADCQHYYENPFRSRWLAARAGLGAWLLHDRTAEQVFANPNSGYFTIVNRAHNDPHDVFSANGPFQFRLNDSFDGDKLASPGQPGGYLHGFESYWGNKDFGAVALSGLQGEQAKEFLFQRIQRSVDRHTNWYQSSYDSSPDLPIDNKARRTISQAFSPFVASSYEMNASDQFSHCGMTIPCGNGGEEFSEHRQWMFIFKVRKDNWFKPEDIIAGKLTPDFDRIWLDETAFGDDSLANSEHAWDRLGTPLEEELSDILYLWRMPANDYGGEDSYGSDEGAEEGGDDGGGDGGAAGNTEAKFWYLDLQPVSADTLYGALMDEFGGAPGEICFNAEISPENAAAEATKLLLGYPNFVAAVAYHGKVAFTLKNPLQPNAGPQSVQHTACLQ